MQSKALIAGIIVLVVLAGGFLYYSQQATAPMEEVQDVSNDTSMLAEDQPVVEMVVDGDVYTVDTAASSLKWHAERIVGNAHDGTVPIVDGQVVVKDDQFVSGQFTVSVVDLTEEANNERFITHVKSDDFFSVDQYPTSQMVITQVEATDEADMFTVTGDLTIKGVTNSVNFPAKIVRDGDNIRATADFTIDRTQWGIVYDSGTILSELGDRAIRDEIEYSLVLVVTPQI